jgi:glycosyltransferase involved in cell wall biosynthesis
MYCGSCMRDNTLAAALQRLGCDAWLIPTYTPIRTDEQDVSRPQVFMGGINMYLQQQVAFFRRLPPFLDHWLDKPWLINWLSSFSIEVNGRNLGALTVSVLRGESGFQKKEIDRLVSWLATEVKPELVNLSNLLIAGCVPAIKRRLGVPVLITLQGDDLFLNQLVEPFKSQALTELRRLAAEADGFIVFSQYYADYMSEWLGVPPERFHIVRMGIQTEGFLGAVESVLQRPSTVGYLARLCPEKGLHVLVDAFIQLRAMPGTEDARLRVAGWLSKQDRKFVEEQWNKLRAAGLGAAFDYAGVVDRQGKIDFLHSLDVLSVPTTYREPKGLFVLEALASGVPVVQPAHGAFPELLAGTGGGLLVRPEDPQHLAEALHRLLTDHDHRRTLAKQGRETVHRDFNAERMALATLDVYRQYCGKTAVPEIA